MSWLPMMTTSGARAASPIRVTRAGVSASSAPASASISMKPSACEKLVTAPEPFAEGNATAPCSPETSDTSTNSLRPISEAIRIGTRASMVCAASGGRPARARITGATKAWKVKIAEVGKPGSTAIGLPSATARQSGLPGFSATPCTRMPGLPSCDTTRCERSPAPFEVPPDSTTMSHSASARRTACSSFAASSGNAPIRHRLAAGLGDGGGEDRAVGIIDAAGPQAIAERDQLVAGREHRDLRPPHHVDRGQPAGRQHADLARADHLALAHQGLAARDVGAGVGDELPRRHAAAQLDRRNALDQLGVLDHHHGVGAARHHAAGGDGGGGAGLHLDLGRMAAGDHLGVERDLLRRAVGCAGGVGRAQREAVDIGAVERRHVDRRREIVRQHAAERGCERHAFGGQGAEIEMALRSAFFASSAETTSRNCSWRAACRTAASNSLSAREGFRLALMATASRRRARRPHGPRCRPE